MMDVVGDYHNPCPYKEDADFWNARREKYVKLLQLEQRLDNEIDESKSWLKPIEYEKIIEILQKVRDGKE